MARHPSREGAGSASLAVQHPRRRARLLEASGPARSGRGGAGGLDDLFEPRSDCEILCTLRVQLADHPAVEAVGLVRAEAAGRRPLLYRPYVDPAAAIAQLHEQIADATERAFLLRRRPGPAVVFRLVREVMLVVHSRLLRSLATRT